MKQHVSITTALRRDARRYPNCRIANCECPGSAAGNRREGCKCLCHPETLEEFDALVRGEK